LSESTLHILDSRDGCATNHKQIDSRMLLIALMTAAAGLIWLMLLMRAAGVYGGCLILLVLASCFGYDFYNVKMGPLPLTTDRVMIGILSGMYVVRRALQLTHAKPLDKGDLLFVAFLLTMVVNTLLHDWRWRDFQPLASLLFLYVCPAAVYWMMRGSVVHDRHIRLLFGLFAAFGVYLGVTAICEVEQLNSLVFPRFIVTTKFSQWIGRARGPFLNPTTNGMYLSTALFALAMCWPHARRWSKAAILVGMLLVITGIIGTLTRSCWIGAGLGVIVIAMASMPRELRMPAVLLGGMIATFFVTVGNDTLLSFKRDKNVSQYHMEQSAKLRPILAAVAWRVFQDYPVFGCGYGQYKRVDVDYLRDPNSELPLEQAKNYVQHNLFLGILVDTGLAGLTLYLGALVFWARRACQLWRDPKASLLERQLGLFLLATLAQWSLNGMFHDVALATNANLLLFLTAGVSEGVWIRRNRTAGVVPSIKNAEEFGMLGREPAASLCGI
jgi:O-antigen ligase